LRYEHERARQKLNSADIVGNAAWVAGAASQIPGAWKTLGPLATAADVSARNERYRREIMMAAIDQRIRDLSRSRRGRY